MSARAVRSEIGDLTQRCYDLAWGLEAADVGDLLPRLVLRITPAEWAERMGPYRDSASAQVMGVTVEPTWYEVQP